MKTLNELANYLQIEVFDKPIPEYALQCCGDLHLDSRALQAGDVFVAIQGEQVHGLQFLELAAQAGVAVIICDRALTNDEQACLNEVNQTRPHALQVWAVEGLSEQLGHLANWFYDAPSQKVKVVGITGTNGKTSCAYFLCQMLHQLNETSAMIGTIGTGLFTSGGSQLKPAVNTTPDAISVHRMLHEFTQQGANWVVMEVSSHAIALGRIAGVEFECVALTQVTSDHLDFHGTTEHYQNTKAALFSDWPSQHQVLNAEDDVGRTLLKTASLSDVWGYGQSLAETQPMQELTGHYVSCEQALLTSQGMEVSLGFSGQQSLVQLGLLGRFNIENVQTVLTILLACGFDWNDVIEHLSALQPVNGRMQVVNDSPTVLVDFAHTEDALKQTLLSVREHMSSTDKTDKKSAQLWVVFGCGGDRDQSKRPLMGRVADELADRVVLTSDNPRSESPQQILHDIQAGLTISEGESEGVKKTVQVIEDRKEAILATLQQACKDDVVVIAGKGHESYQEINGTRYPFSDKAVVEQWLQQ